MNTTAELSPRESQIAELLAWGSSKKEIATKLFISPRTVETTARNIYQKAGIGKVGELSAWWFCKSFNISFDLSPLKRSIVAVALLLLLIPKEILTSSDVFRGKRATKTAQSRTSKKCKETDLTYLYN